MTKGQEEQKYKQLKKLGRELNVPVPEAFLTLEVFDKDGKLISRHHQRSHSWVRNAYNMLFSGLAGKDGSDSTFEAGKLSIRGTNGTVEYGTYPIAQIFSSSIDGTAYGYRAAAGEDSWGILVGSGENAESFEDYVLQTQIDDGSGGGQLNHVASEAHAITYTDTTLTNTLIRYFNNNSGGSIDVNEVALVVRAKVQNLTRQWLQSRDKLASTVSVPDTGQLKVTYTIQLAYTA